MNRDDVYRARQASAVGFLSAVAVLGVVLLIGLATGAAVPTGKVNVLWTNASTATDGSPLIGSNQLVRTTVEHGTCSAPGVFGTKRGEDFVPYPQAVIEFELPVATHCFRAFHTTAGGGNSAMSNTAMKAVGETAPLPAPPTGLKAKQRVVYTVLKRPDAFVVLPVGSTADTTACLAEYAVRVAGETYTAIPREAVEWSGTVQPDIVVAKCS